MTKRDISYFAIMSKIYSFHIYMDFTNSTMEIMPCNIMYLII